MTLAFQRLASPACVRTSHALFVILLLAVLTGCGSSNTLNTGKALSLAGVQAAGDIKANLLVSDAMCQGALDSEALISGLSTNQQARRDADQKQALIAAIQREFASRERAIAKLGALYAAFGDLCSYDASGEVEKASKAFAKSINDYAPAVGQPAPLSDSAPDAIGKAGGFLANAIQQERVIVASKNISSLIDVFLNLLRDKAVRTQLANYKQFILADRNTALQILWNYGVYDPTPLLTDFGSVAGLAVKKEYKLTQDQQTLLSRALGEVLRSRLSRNVRFVEQSYDQTIEILERLKAEHAKLENRSQVDLTTLATATATLNTLASSLNQKPTAK